MPSIERADWIKSIDELAEGQDEFEPIIFRQKAYRIGALALIKEQPTFKRTQTEWKLWDSFVGLGSRVTTVHEQTRPIGMEDV